MIEDCRIAASKPVDHGSHDRQYGGPVDQGHWKYTEERKPMIPCCSDDATKADIGTTMVFLSHPTAMGIVIDAARIIPKIAFD